MTFPILRRRKYTIGRAYWPHITNMRCSYWYRTMFDEHFPPSCASTVMRWTPKWVKQTDPSGR